MTEARRIYSACLLELKPIRRPQLLTVKHNPASRRAAEKCSCRLDGPLRGFAFVSGQFVDCVFYALLRRECPSLSELL